MNQKTKNALDEIEDTRFEYKIYKLIAIPAIALFVLILGYFLTITVIALIFIGVFNLGVHVIVGFFGSSIFALIAGLLGSEMINARKRLKKAERAHRDLLDS